MVSHMSSDVKDVILRVLEFCKEEKYNRRPIIPLNKANLRVATATGVSLHTVTNIIREGKIAALNGTKIGVIKQRKPRRGKIIFNQSTKDLINDTIQKYSSEHKKWPSLRNLLPLVRNRIEYANCIETFRESLKQMGFIFEKTGNNILCVLPQSSIPEVNPVELFQVDYVGQQEIILDHDYSKIIE